MLRYMRDMAELIAVACTSAGSVDHGYKPDELAQTIDTKPASPDAPVKGPDMMM